MNYLIYLSIILATFALGVVIAVVWFVYRTPVDVPQIRELEIEPISVCELVVARKWYIGTVIPLRAVVPIDRNGAISETAIFDVNCSTPWAENLIWLDKSLLTPEVIARVRKESDVEKHIPDDKPVSAFYYLTMRGEVTQRSETSDCVGEPCGLQFVIYNIEAVEQVRRSGAR